VVKRTQILDKDNHQLYFDEGLCKYDYYVIVTNSSEANGVLNAFGDPSGGPQDPR